MSEIVLSALEQKMLQSLKQTIRTITRDSSGLLTIKQSHYLNGTFIQLCDPRLMKELLFPGTPEDILSKLPKNLVEILEWKELCLNDELPQIAKKAAEVLTNIKGKGAKQGNFMDAATENVLLPQIAQEALSKGLIDLVRKLNRKVSNVMSKISQKVASSEDERSQMDQLNQDLLNSLLENKFGFQYPFQGEEWTDLIVNDLKRYIQYEKMTLIDESGEVLLKPEFKSSSNSSNSFAEMCWLEDDENLNENYPAVAEIIKLLHALPFEINGKKIYDNFELLEPLKGSTMLTYYPPGSQQKSRLDSREDNSSRDSGIRFTCSYYFKADSANDVHETNSSLVFDNIEFHTSKTKKIDTIIIKDDMLVLHQSTKLINSKQFDEKSDWFCLTFFMHGRELISQKESTLP